MATATTRLHMVRTKSKFAFHTYPLLVSPKQARDTIAETEYPFQRPLRAYQVAFLAALIAHRQLREGTTISFAAFRRTRQRYMINGRHTMTALGQSSGPAYPLQFEVFEVDTEDEVSRLYQSFDRNLPRSWKDLYRADTLLHRQELPPTVLDKLGGVTQLLVSGFQQTYHFTGRAWYPILKNAYVRFNLMYDWMGELENLHNGLAGQSVTGGTRKLLMRASVLSLALITYRFQPHLAHTFWPRLARDSGLLEGEPEWALLRYLREFTTRALDPATYQRTVAAAWNCSYNKRPVGKLQPRKASEPLLLLGTPHDGEGHYGYLGADGTVYREPRPLQDTPVAEEQRRDTHA